MNTMRYLSDVVTLGYEQDLCIGCGRCVEVCPRAVFAMKNGKAAVEDREACMECGACSRNCPAAALSVEAGVGCAAAVITGFFKNSAPTCDCSGDSSCC